MYMLEVLCRMTVELTFCDFFRFAGVVWNNDGADSMDQRLVMFYHVV